MTGVVDRVTGPLGTAFEFLKKNYKSLSIKFGKLYLLVGLAMIIASVIVGGIALLALGGTFALSGNIDMIVLIPVIFVGVVLFLALSIVNNSLTTVGYNIVHEKKEVNIIEKARELLNPIAKYVIIVSAISLAIIAVFGVILFALVSTVSNIGILLSILVIFLAFLVLLIFKFFIQFSFQEIAINGKDAVDALKTSYALVRKNIVAVLLFDITLFLVVVAIGMVFGVFRAILGIVFSLSIVNIVFALMGVAFAIILMFVQVVVISSVMFPAQYFFWKSIGGIRAK